MGTYESCPILTTAHATRAVSSRGTRVFVRSELPCTQGMPQSIFVFQDASHGTRSAFLARDLLIPFNRFDPLSYNEDHVLTPVEECQVTGRNTTHVEIPQAAVVCCNTVRPGTDTALVRARYKPPSITCITTINVRQDHNRLYFALLEYTQGQEEYQYKNL